VSGIARQHGDHRLDLLRRFLEVDVEPRAMDDVIPLVTSSESLLDLLAECRTCGVDEIYVHNVSRDQTGFMRFMAREILPAVATTR